jgi:hypothetical protein
MQPTPLPARPGKRNPLENGFWIRSPAQSWTVESLILCRDTAQVTDTFIAQTDSHDWLPEEDEMFVALLVVLLSIALLITSVVVWLLRPHVRGILNRLVGESLADAWVSFLVFALYVVGIASAVQAYRLDKYVIRAHERAILAELNLNTWVLEAYQSVRSVLGGLAWSLMSFFIVALVAVIIVRAFELKREMTGGQAKDLADG